MPGYQHTMQRRFDLVAAHDFVKKYEAKAKEARSSNLRQLAEDDAATRTLAEVDNTAEVSRSLNPQEVPHALIASFSGPPALSNELDTAVSESCFPSWAIC